MSAKTEIAWCDHTFNPWWGCTRVSPGCQHCYAEAWSARFGGDHWGPGKPRRRFGEKHWREPLAWNDAAAKAGVRRRVFCASMADVGDVEAPSEDLSRLWRLIEDTPALDWLLLSKRPERFREILPFEGPTGNIWIGTTVENQAAADERIPHLLATPAAVRFLSCEPLLGPVDLTWAGPMPDGDYLGKALFNHGAQRGDGAGLDWVIIGGESGPGARPCDVAWVRSLVEQCKAAGVPAFVKQDSGRRAGQQGRIPDDLWIKEMPHAHP